MKRNRLEEAATMLEKIWPECASATTASATYVAKQLATFCNLLSGSNATQVGKWLRMAEHTLQSILGRRQRESLNSDEALLRLQLLTYNNWATLHKGKRNYHMALNYLMRASKVVEVVGVQCSPDTLEFCAKTRLNTSALYSDLRSYRDAILHAEQCLATLQQELNARLNGRQLDELSVKEKTKFETMITTYVVAFYNIGVAEEAMGQMTEAVQAFRNAVSIGAKFLPADNSELATAQAALKSTPQMAGRDTKVLDSEEYRLMLETQLQQLDVPEQPTPPFARTQEAVSTKEPFKYYTPERLQTLHSRLCKGAKAEFVSADKFFLSKITAALDVSRDVKHMRPLSA